MSATDEPKEIVNIEILPRNPWPLDDTIYDNPDKQENPEEYKHKGSFTKRWHWWTADKRGPQHSWAYMLAHYLYFFWEFFMRHFFVLSGSMRIYLLAYFVIAGGAFYAVAPTLALGYAFFFGSIVIALALSNFARWVNKNVDSDYRHKQLKIQNMVDHTYESIEVQQSEIKQSAEQKSSDDSANLTLQPTKAQPSHEEWQRIEDMKGNNFSWLNYKNVLNNTNYKYIIYAMDVLVVVAAMWNIIEEILRWQAVLPFSATLAAMGPFWIIFTLSIFAFLCLAYKMYYTYPVTNVRINNVILLQRARNLFEHTIKQNKVLQSTLATIDAEELKQDKIKNLLQEDTQGGKIPSASIYTRATAALGAVLAGGLLGYALYTAIASTVPLWSLITVLALSCTIASYCIYRFLAWRIHAYKMRENINAQVKQAEKSARVLEDLKDYANKPRRQYKQSKYSIWEKFYKTTRGIKWWTLLASLTLSGLFTFIAWSLVPAIPLWPLIVIPLFSFIALTGIFKLVLIKFAEWDNIHARDSEDAQKQRKAIEAIVIAMLAKEHQDQYTASQREHLAGLAYSLWKLKNVHRFRPHRNLVDEILDRIGIPLWNAVVTIFPTFFILNGICVTVFLLPSVLSSWPLFLLELIPAIILAVDFGRRKLGDNHHDLNVDAACDILAEIINKENGKLTVCVQDGLALESFGLRNKPKESSTELHDVKSQRVLAASIVPPDTALTHSVDAFGFSPTASKNAASPSVDEGEADAESSEASPLIPPGNAGNLKN